MPYHLQESEHPGLFYVVTTKTGKRHSNEPLPKVRAEAQMRALYRAERLKKH